MPRLNNLVFRTNKIDISTECVLQIFLTKVFHLHQRRNEWTNWRGDTSLVKRTFSRFDISLQESTDSAEKLRTQGTAFIIDEAPAICVVGSRYALIVTELFTENPFVDYDLSGLKESVPISLRDIESKLNLGRWFVSAIYTGKPENLSPVSDNEMFYSRISSSTSGKNNLAWSLKLRNINRKQLTQCISEIQAYST